ncbi:hypothetical protein T481_02890, partial [Enterococcus faecalis PF3]
MNKQEKEDLIQALYDIGGCDAEDEWSRGYDDGVNASIEVVKELKVQGKVALPKSADEFIKEGLSMGSDKVDIIDSAVSFSSAMPTAEFSMWFKTNGDLLIDALANGYEVEKEPLYHVLLSDKGATNIGYTFLNLTGTIDFTICKERWICNRKSIKAIDERYWA